MRVFGTDHLRGCFAAFDIDTSESQGAVLQLPEGGSINTLPKREGSDGGPLHYGMLVTSISFDQAELVNFLKCFGSRIYTYAFGADLGNLTVQYVGFLAGGVGRTLGQQDSATEFVDSKVVSNFLTAYDEGRVSRSGKLASISLNGVALRGLIVGMRSSTKWTQQNIQAFTMQLKLVSIQGTTPATDNTAQIGGGGGPTATVS